MPQCQIPEVFHGNVLDGMVSDAGRHWVASSLSIDFQEISASLGLDACMAIEYSSFGARLMLTIGLLATKEECFYLQV